MLFLVFELTVSILMINMLIAMMARTYQAIMETQKEWKRQVPPPSFSPGWMVTKMAGSVQWAKVILMLERALEPEERLQAQLKYSRPIGTNATTRAFVVQYRRSVAPSPASPCSEAKAGDGC